MEQFSYETFGKLCPLVTQHNWNFIYIEKDGNIVHDQFLVYFNYTVQGTPYEVTPDGIMLLSPKDQSVIALWTVCYHCLYELRQPNSDYHCIPLETVPDSFEMVNSAGDRFPTSPLLITIKKMS